MRVRGEQRLRRVARRTPGLPRVYWWVRRRVLLKRRLGRLDYQRAEIDVRVTSRTIVRDRLFPVAKEPWTVDWIERSLRPGDVLYDIGANIGVYALIAGLARRSSTKVIAIEPAYANYAELCENIVLNGLQDIVVPLPVVLGDRRRVGVLGYSTLEPGAALHQLDTGKESGYRQPVLVQPLDALIEDFGLPAPTLVKLDVDGAESQVLAGASETLRRPVLRSLIIEIDNSLSDVVLATMTGAGFVLVDRFDDRQGEPLPGIWYGIFDRSPAASPSA